jgi:hypothetical protein
MVLNVSVIPKRIISDYTDVFDQAGIYPLSYEIESKMIANSVIPIFYKKIFSRRGGKNKIRNYSCCRI